MTISFLSSADETIPEALGHSLLVFSPDLTLQPSTAATSCHQIAPGDSGVRSGPFLDAKASEPRACP